MKKYISLVLLKSTNQKTSETFFDETFIEIKSNTIEEAKELAEQYGKSCEVSYENQYGETLQITFIEVIHTTSPLRDETEFENGVRELYSQSFDTYDRNGNT